MDPNFPEISQPSKRPSAAVFPSEPAPADSGRARSIHKTGRQDELQTGVGQGLELLGASTSKNVFLLHVKVTVIAKWETRIQTWRRLNRPEPFSLTALSCQLGSHEFHHEIRMLCKNLQEMSLEWVGFQHAFEGVLAVSTIHANQLQCQFLVLPLDCIN